eukprot:GHVS01105977.1.p1 GENE.GHVS01105977.1~~GHVS01105977.1.p1  ORF type:complete len:134 (-),score=15.76 GHVS01105977.1:321-722(-)
MFRLHRFLIVLHLSSPLSLVWHESLPVRSTTRRQLSEDNTRTTQTADRVLKREVRAKQTAEYLLPSQDKPRAQETRYYLVQAENKPRTQESCHHLVQAEDQTRAQETGGHLFQAEDNLMEEDQEVHQARRASS